MLKIKWFVHFSFICVVTMQLALGEAIAQIPRAKQHSISIDSLMSKLKDFKEVTLGRSVTPPHCSQAAQSPQNNQEPNQDSLEYEDYMKQEQDYVYGIDFLQEQLLSSSADEYSDQSGVISLSPKQIQSYFDEKVNLEVNACGEKVFKVVGGGESTKQSVDPCTPTFQEGLFNRIAKFVVLIDEEEKEREDYFKDLHNKVELHFQNAEKLLPYVQDFLEDDDLSVQMRRNLLANYVDQVVLPSRDIFIMTRELYKKTKYNYLNRLLNLIPIFNKELYEGASNREKSKVELGLSPSQSQNHLKFVEKEGKETLVFDATSIVQRDIKSLLQAPSMSNYAMAAKWMTLHMMAKQIYFYKSIVFGDDSPIETPNSCQSDDNGNFPKTIKFKLGNESMSEEQIRATFLNNLIEGYGLTLPVERNKNSVYYQYFMENNSSKNPLEQNYNGIAPFQQLKAADKIQKGQEKSPFLKVYLNDITHFDKVINLKQYEIAEIFTKKEKGRVRNRERKTYEIKGKDVIEKILTRPDPNAVYEIKLGSGDIAPTIINPNEMNLSNYIVEKMQLHQTAHYYDLLSIQTKKYLKNDTEVKIDFPSLYGANVWRQWALFQLKDIFMNYKNSSNKSELFKLVRNACTNHVPTGAGSYWGIGANINSFNKSLCGESSKNILEHVANYLDNLIQNGDYKSLKRIDESKLKQDWKTLGKIWTNLRDRTELLPIAKMNEFDFIRMQMEAKNPWAMARVGYLIAIEELKSQRDGFKPTFVKNARGYNRRDHNTTCFYSNVNTKINALEKVGKVFGLDNSINLNHADKILNEDELKYVWNQVYGSFKDSSNNLLTQKVKNKRTYELLDDISYQTLLTDRDAINFSKGNGLSSFITNEVKQDWETFSISPLGRLGAEVLELYKMKGNTDDQVDKVESMMSSYDLINNQSSKRIFLEMDSFIKRPLFAGVLKQSAQVRMEDIEKRMDDFCQLKSDEFEQIQATFQQTTASHTELNKLAGLSNEQIEKINDKITSMSPSEWADIGYALGGIGLTILAIVIGSACTGITGGLCAPLGAAMVASALGGIYLQTALFGRELNRKLNADEFEKQTKLMEELGFSTEGSSEVVSRSSAWAIIEAVSIWPLVGTVLKSVRVGTRMMVASSNVLIKELGKRPLHEVSALMGKQNRAVALEADILQAQWVAGQSTLKSRSTEFTEAFKQNMLEINKIKVLFLKKKITFKQAIALITPRLLGIKNLIRYTDSGEYVGKVVLKSTKETDQDVINTFVKYWGKDLKSYYDHVKGMWGRWSVASKWRGNRLNYARHVMERVSKNDYPRGYNWVKKLQYGHLAEVAPKLENLRRHLKPFVENGHVTVKTASGPKVITTPEDFVKHFMEDMTEIHRSMGMRIKEAPYMFFLQGGPHAGGFFGKRVPNLLGGFMGDNFMMRKLFTARARLYYESQKAVMKSVLNLPQHVGTDSVYRTFKAFTASVEEAADKAGVQEGEKILSKLAETKTSIAKAVAESTKKQNVEKKLYKLIGAIEKDMGSRVKAFEAFPSLFTKVDSELINLSRKDLIARFNFSEEQFAKILFTPKTQSESAFAEIVWSTIPTDELFNLKGIQGLAYQVAQELKSYKNVDEFDRYLNALKIIVIKRDPLVVETM